MKILHQGEELPDKRLAFDLALGPATATSVALIGGGSRGFATLAQLHTAWRSLLVKHTLIVPPVVARLIPTNLAPVVFDPATRSDQLWRTLDAAGLVIAGVDMQPSSHDQTLLSKLFTKLSQPIFLTDELLGLWRADSDLHHQGNVSIVARVETILNLAQLSRVEQRRLQARGIYGVAERIEHVSKSSPLIIAYGDDTCYVYVRSEETLIVVNHQLSVDHIRRVLLALIPVTLSARTERVNLLNRVRVGMSIIARLHPDDPQDDAWIKLVRQTL